VPSNRPHPVVGCSVELAHVSQLPERDCPRSDPENQQAKSLRQASFALNLRQRFPAFKTTVSPCNASRPSLIISSRRLSTVDQRFNIVFLAKVLFNMWNCLQALNLTSPAVAPGQPSQLYASDIQYPYIQHASGGPQIAVCTLLPTGSRRARTSRHAESFRLDREVCTRNSSRTEKISHSPVGACRF
jgi:hypothetical protein